LSHPPPPPHISTLSLHDALPILHLSFRGIHHDVITMQYFAIEDFQRQRILNQLLDRALQRSRAKRRIETFSEQQLTRWIRKLYRSEEHTSELQSPYDLVCRLLLE